MKKILSIILGTTMIFGCASSPESIKAIPQQDDVYNNLSCAEVEIERLRIEDAVTEATGQRQAARKKDQAMVILFPAALLLKDKNKENAIELGKLKGQFESIQRVSAEKGCANSE